MKVVNTLDPQVWKKFVDEHPQGNAFHTPEMFEVYSRTRGYRPFLWAVVDLDGTVLALFPLAQITLMGGPLQLVTTRNIAFGSLLAVGGELGKEALALLLKAYNRQVSRWPLFTELRNTHDLSGFQDVLQGAGFAYEEHLNYHLDLRRDLNDILQSFSSSARQRIRQSVRRGMNQAREIIDRTELPVMYELLRKTYHTARIPLADLSMFEAAYDVLLPKNMVRFSVTFIDGTPVSSLVSILYKDIVYGWYHGTDREYGSYSPNEFIYWDGIQWAKERGYGILDLGGAGKPGEDFGVRDFKAKFNGQTVSYGRNIYVHAPWRLKLSQTTYELVRNVLSAFRGPSDRKTQPWLNPNR